MKARKYNYFKIIQGNYGYGQGWNDEDFHECNSRGAFYSKEARQRFKENLKAYQENGGGAYRVIFRKEAIKDEN